MPATQFDKEVQAYMRGRKDELHEVYRVLEICRRFGHIDLDTASKIIDHLNRVERNVKENIEDGE